MPERAEIEAKLTRYLAARLRTPEYASAYLARDVLNFLGVRDARGDDEACPDCWGGRPKWAGTMPAPPCPTCDGTGKRCPQGEDHEPVCTCGSKAVIDVSRHDETCWRRLWRLWVENIRDARHDDEVERLRAINAELVEAHNTLLVEAGRSRDARGDDEVRGQMWGDPPAARSPQGEDHEAGRRKLIVDWTENGDPILLDPSVGPPHPVVGTHDLPAPSRDGTVAVDKKEEE